MKFKVLIIIFFFLIFFLFILKNKERDFFEIRIGNEKLVVWVAENLSEKSKGLSGIKELKEVDGMLFIFKEETVPSFWMKEMNFPIDIIWISADKEIIEVTENILPETYPRTFSPKEPVKYVLEVKANWVKKKNIKIGDELVL